MNTFLVTLGLVATILTLFFIGVGIRIILIKDGQFKGTCSSNNPMINTEGEACSLCGAMPDEQCKGDDEQKQQSSSLPKVNA